MVEKDSPFIDQSNDFSFSNDTTLANSVVSPTAPRPRVLSDESFKTAHTAANDSFDSDSESIGSPLPTPTLQHFPRTTSPGASRKPSLRFQLPASKPPSVAVPASPLQVLQNTFYSTPAGTSSSSVGSTATPRNKVGSPFMDSHVIHENEVFGLKKPQSPFLDDTFDRLAEEPNSDDEYYKFESPGAPDVDRNDTVMKRHRWGTTRNKRGRPEKENVNRSKTLKGLLRHNTASRSRRNTPRGRQDSIRKPSTLDAENDDSDAHSATTEQQDGEPEDLTDRRAQKRTIVFNRLLPDEFLDPETGAPATSYPRNKIRTTKYTPLSFIPKNVSNQFLHNVANIYFLFLIILGAFDIFGVPSPVLAAVPLIVIVCLTAIKDAIEDSRRTVTDMEVNNQAIHILTQESASSEYVYANNNVNDEKVSLWRRFKKMNSRFLFRTIDAGKRNLTKEGRANKLRQQQLGDAAIANKENNRKSFDSQVAFSPRNSSSDNPFKDQRDSFQAPRKSMQLVRKSFQTHPRTLKYAKKFWKDVRVGDMLRIYNNEEIPADMIILATSDDDNCCFTETKNLDGETNLKVKQALKYGSSYHNIRKADDLVNATFEIDSEGPHANLYSYQGNFKYGYEKGEYQQEAITINNMLLRGCMLRNTKWVVGIVAFTGSDTKIMINSGITPTKQSRVSRELNYYVYLNFILLFVVCFASGLINGLWYRTNGVSRDYFEFGTIAGSPWKNGLVGFFVALILYQSLVPISLYITIEIIKTAQAFFIYSDINMYYERLDYPCTPKSWSISDDLGQIEYVFSDKTGTLTQNLMEFKKCTINGVSYGRAYTEALAGLRKRQGVDVDSEATIEREHIARDRVDMVDQLKALSNGALKYTDEITFVSKPFVEDLQGKAGGKQKLANETFMLALALCHSVLVEEDPKNPEKMLLKAQSPDEAALVGTARSLGFEFTANTKKGVIVNIHGTAKEYQILNTLEFNSTRKRMSAIVKIPADSPEKEPRALLVCKGADSIIYGRLLKSNNDRRLLDTTSAHLEEFATEGLRTLCIAQRELTWLQYTEWNNRHKQAASALDDREAKMEAVADSIERELILLGGTAIEDRLQDGVPDAIALLGDAGIKLWVLTGDKVETAINIGFSCNLLGNDMELLVLKTKLSAEDMTEFGLNPDLQYTETQLVSSSISHYLKQHFDLNGTVEDLDAIMGDHSPPDPRFGVVIDGDALKIALLDVDTRRKFLLLCKHCRAVLCCRVSPAQKAAVVKLVKDTLDVMTLAIGDGSNDVAMIQAADVGVGIAGEEGRQAVMSSDYAIGQFRFLVKLLLVHGRWSYKRFSEMIPSFFYKNTIFSIALFWYGIYNNFDGSYLFEFTYLMFYNLAFTSLPIIFLCVFDQDVSAKVSLLVPQLYRTGIVRSEWTQKKFWVYVADAIYQSAISFFFPYLMYYKGFQSSNALPVDHRFWIGILVTAISCISCNLYILFHQYRWDWLSVLIVAISILIIYTWTGLWTSAVYSKEFYKAAAQVFGLAAGWACTFIGILVCLMPRFFYDFSRKIFWPKDVDIIRECEQRGDFAAYPENYDPTDPNRVKISAYSSDQLRRISMNVSTPVENSPRFYKNGGLSSSTGSATDVDNLNYFGQSTGVSNADAMVTDHHPLPSPDLTSMARTGARESVVNRRANTTYGSDDLHVEPVSRNTVGQRKSVLDIFKRKSQGVSYYDNNSLIETYNFSNGTTDDLTNIQTEEIAMEDFKQNQQVASRISSERRHSAQGPSRNLSHGRAL